MVRSEVALHCAQAGQVPCHREELRQSTGSPTGTLGEVQGLGSSQVPQEQC